MLKALAKVMDPLDLANRDSFPDALRVLLEEYPRDAWESHSNFSELIKFWLDRHLMFRRLLTQLNDDAEAMLGRKSDPHAYARRVHQYGGLFLSQLHAHHHIEDSHYFPQLITLEARVSRGFELLDADHHALEALLERFQGRANTVLEDLSDPDFRDHVAAFRTEITGFERLLDRHLVDEEELIVPVLLKHAPQGLA